jgi:hypothetical protein
MSNTEEAVQGLEELFLTDYPTYLRAVELEFTDGVELESIREVTWEEYDDGVGLQLPVVMIVPEDESDPSLRDILYDCRVTVIFMFADSSKRNVTKKMFRYAKALRRMLKPSNNRSLRGKVNSAKVSTIRWLPTGRGIGDMDNLFARGFEADLVLRIPKEGDA